MLQVVLKHFESIEEGNSSELIVVNPATIPTHHLFGILHLESSKWIDGVISASLR